MGYPTNCTPGGSYTIYRQKNQKIADMLYRKKVKELTSEFEQLLEDQFQLDLCSDMKLHDKTANANFTEWVEYLDTSITEGINNCLCKMNKRR